MKKQLTNLLLVGATLVLPGLVMGQSDFIGGGDGVSWEDATNWSAGIPVGVNADIEDGFAVTLSTDQSIGELDVVGDQSVGVTTLNHTAGTLTGAGWMKVGGGPEGGGGSPTDGTYNLSDSAIADGFADMFIGFRGGTGALSISDTASVTVTSVRLAAEQANSTGTINISDSATLNTGNFNMAGEASTGTVNQTGGTVTSNQWVALANFGSGGTATYNISGGSVFANDGNIAVGQDGTGTLNVSGTAVVSQSFVAGGDQTGSGILVGGVNDPAVSADGAGTLSITGSSASISGADLRVSLTEGSSGMISWIADAGGITEIVSADNTDFGPGTSNLVLDLSADPASATAGTEYVLIDNGAAVTGTFSGVAEGATVSIGGGLEGTVSYVGGADGFDIVVTAVGGAGATGDFDGNNVVNCDDLDGYVNNLGQSADRALAQLDLNGNGMLDADDANTVLTTLVETSNGGVGTSPGDVNCDGVVNVLGDALALVTNLNASVTRYGQGDLNFDGTVNVLGDALILVTNLGNTNQ